MFQKSVAEKLPIKEKKESNISTNLFEKITDTSSEAHLTPKDVNLLSEEAKSLKRKKLSWVQSLQCCS